MQFERVIIKNVFLKKMRGAVGDGEERERYIYRQRKKYREIQIGIYYLVDYGKLQSGQRFQSGIYF